MYLVATVPGTAGLVRQFGDSTMNGARGLTFGGPVKEEVVLSKIDSAIGLEIAVKLLTYADGSMDLFRPQGNQFREHLAEAKALLRERGLCVGDVELMAPTGGYLSVWAREARALPTAATQEDPRRLFLAPFAGYEALIALEDSQTRRLEAGGLRMVN